MTPVGDTTAREISAASQEVRDALERLAGVERIEPQRVPAPDQAKSGLVEALGGFAVSLVPDVLKGVFQVLQIVLSRQPAADQGVDQDQGRRDQFRIRSKENKPS
jgi:hypothetical protein